MVDTLMSEYTSRIQEKIKRALVDGAYVNVSRIRKSVKECYIIKTSVNMHCVCSDVPTFLSTLQPPPQFHAHTAARFVFESRLEASVCVSVSINKRCSGESALFSGMSFG